MCLHACAFSSSGMRLHDASDAHKQPPRGDEGLVSSGVVQGGFTCGVQPLDALCVPGLDVWWDAVYVCICGRKSSRSTVHKGAVSREQLCQLATTLLCDI